MLSQRSAPRRWPLWLGLGCVILLTFLPGILHRRAREATEGFHTAGEVLQEWLRNVQEQKRQLGQGPPEVFQVGPPKFSFQQAQERCQRYGGRLATMDELQEAGEKGAHWCRSGWIADGRVALVKSTENAEGCPAGAPGVFAETYPSTMKFAATCYAPRPHPGVHWQSEVERRHKEMEAEKVRAEAEASVRFVATLRQQLEDEQRHRNDMLQDEVVPFNGQRLLWGQGH